MNRLQVPGEIELTRTNRAALTVRLSPHELPGSAMDRILQHLSLFLCLSACLDSTAGH